jgi:hypothetical protein
MEETWCRQPASSARVEHVLGEQSLVLARDRNRGDVVEVLGLQCAREFDRVSRSADVHRRVQLGRRRHVVDGGEVHEMGDLSP